MLNLMSRHYGLVKVYSHQLSVPLHLLLVIHYETLAAVTAGLVLLIYTVATIYHNRCTAGVPDHD